MTNRWGEPSSNELRQCFCVAVTVVAVVLLVFGVCLHRGHSKVADNFRIQLAGGQFAANAELTGDTQTPIQLLAKANQPISLEFDSLDYVYTVFQPGQNVATVILPGKSAMMNLQLPVGMWELKMVDGCGTTAPAHNRVLILKAVDRY